MRARGFEIDTLDSVRPTDLAGYLAGAGWREKQHRDAFSLWTAPADERSEILVPFDRSYGDFYARLAEALETIVETERRSNVDSIIADLRARSEDVFRVRLEGSETADGTVPFHRGKVALARAEAMLEAAAASAIQPSSVHVYIPDAARAFVENNARLGQTERGSYVLTIHSRLPEEALFPEREEEPFQRQVFETLVSGLDATRRAVREKEPERALAASVGRGVSSNLCRAVYSIAQATRATLVEFSVRWAVAKPPRVQLPTSVTFERPVIGVIGRAARILAHVPPRPGFLVKGFVKKLERENPTVWDELGSIAILADVGQLDRVAVTVKLGEHEYREALHAHENGREVACVGELIQVGDLFRLEKPVHFRIV